MKIKRTMMNESDSESATIYANRVVKRARRFIIDARAMYMNISVIGTLGGAMMQPRIMGRCMILTEDLCPGLRAKRLSL